LKKIFWMPIALILYSIFARIPIYASSDGTGTPESLLGLWESGNGNIRMDLREAGDGTFTAVIVWVSPEAEEKARSRLGEPLAFGLSWNRKTNVFENGVLNLSGNGREGTLSCDLSPHGPNNLVLTARKGILTRKSEWTRISSAE